MVKRSVAGNVIVLFLIMFLIMNLNRSLEQGIVCYIVCSMLSPHFHISNIQISFEIISFFIVMLFVFLKKSDFLLCLKSKFQICYIVFFLLYISATLIAVIKYDGNASWFSLFGIFRWIIILLLFSNAVVDKQKYYEYILDIVITVNFVVSIIQLLCPGSVSLFYELYYKSSMTPLAGMKELGYFNRAYGTFGTPILLGVISLIAYSFYLGKFLETKEKKQIVVKLLLSLMCCLLSITKTAILGASIVTMIVLLGGLFQVFQIKLRKLFFAYTAIAVAGCIVIFFLWHKNFAIGYYLSFIMNPIKSLESRFSPKTGNMAETLKQINNLFIGTGGYVEESAFLGDSTYVGLLYSVGFLGTFLYLGVMLTILFRSLKNRNVVPFLTMLSLLLCGIGVSLEFKLLIIPSLVFSMETCKLGRKIWGKQEVKIE